VFVLLAKGCLKWWSNQEVCGGFCHNSQNS